MPGAALWAHLAVVSLLVLAWALWGAYQVRRPARPDFYSHALTEHEAAWVRAFRHLRNVAVALVGVGFLAIGWAASHYGLGEWGAYSLCWGLFVLYLLALAVPKCPRCGNRIYVVSNGWHWENCLRCRVCFQPQRTSPAGPGAATARAGTG